MKKAFVVASALLLAGRLMFMPAFQARGEEPVKDSIAKLTDGATSLPKCGLPGPIVPFDKGAFPLVLGDYNGGASVPVVSCATLKRGRVVAFGHTDYCKSQVMGKSDSSKRFYRNVFVWASGKVAGDPSNIRIAVWRDKNAVEFLRNLGFDSFVLKEVADGFDVLLADACAPRDEEYAEIFRAVENGAGFVTCGLGWGWSQLNPGKNLQKDHPGNRNFAKYGVNLAWTDGTVDSLPSGEYAIDGETVQTLKFIDGAEVLEFISGLADNPDDAREQMTSLNKDELRQLAASEGLIYPLLSAEKRQLINGLAERFSASIIPTEKSPVKSDDALARMIVSIQTQILIKGQVAGETAPETVTPLPASADFPGSVPATAERLNNVSVSVKTADPDWNSTGLYAAPGEVITVSVDPKLFAKFPKPFSVRIGSHRDTLWHKDSWQRYPEICIERTMTSPELKIANPFGGLVYIVVPKGIASFGLGRISFSISGAVSAPYFVKDETSLEEWGKLRTNPAPWAELHGRNVIVTVPSKVIRDLDDPQKLMTTWDRILDTEAEFASGSYVRERPERICCDRQISAGYMHSGYPVMTWMDVERNLVDNNRLEKDGDWGFYHEFGHNHQSPHWTWNGMTEVTVNYFTLYLMEKLNGRKAGDARAELGKDRRIKSLKQYLANGAKYEDLVKDPFLALCMTVQMQEEFGWEPFLRTVNEYRKADAASLPRSDQEKRDQWMTRLSKNTGRNLGDFFEKWGVHISDEARASVSDLQAWMSSDFNEIKDDVD